MLADKELAPVLDSLLPLADEVIVTTPNSVRAGAPEAITAQVSARGVVARTIPAVAEAVRMALAAATPDDLVLITGSLYLIGEVRPLLRDLLR
jgi:dihydrofolate synthase/folylpolyglutamate synthase